VQVTYRLDGDVIKAYLEFANRRNPRAHRMILVARVLGAAATIWTVVVLSRIGAGPIRSLGDIVARLWPLAVGLGALLVVRLQKSPSLPRQPDGSPTEMLCTVSLEPDGLRYKGDAWDKVSEWKTITEVAATSNLIVFVKGAKFGPYVPTDAFANAEERNAFIQTARAYRDAASGLTTSVPPPPPAVWPPAPTA